MIIMKKKELRLFTAEDIDGSIDIMSMLFDNEGRDLSPTGEYLAEEIGKTAFSRSYWEQLQKCIKLGDKKELRGFFGGLVEIAMMVGYSLGVRAATEAETQTIPTPSSEMIH